ncbi:hypothetical protein [Bacillus cereus]|nr:hypothetical protein [Bacillus cereus]
MYITSTLMIVRAFSFTVPVACGDICNLFIINVATGLWFAIPH